MLFVDISHMKVVDLRGGLYICVFTCCGEGGCYKWCQLYISHLLRPWPY